jgi:hypothetical protein
MFCKNMKENIASGMILELVEWTGHILRDDKKGYIHDHLPDILTRLNIDPRHWLT